MHRILAALALTATLALPAAARAGFLVEGSVGKGAQLSPSPVKAEPTNIMIAPGYSIPFLRLELGLVNSLPDAANKKYDIGFRPMVVIAPPIFPLYGRAIFAVTNLLHKPVEVAYGGALGLKLGLGPIGVFAEAGVLPRLRKFTDTSTMTTESKFAWIIEGRIGALLEF
jgi:hypothetical protein